MSDPVKSTRSWFQFHLSTATMLVFVIGAFVGLNLKPEKRLKFYDNLGPEMVHGDDVAILGHFYRGWQFRMNSYSVELTDIARDKGKETFEYAVTQWTPKSYDWHVAALTGNVAIGLSSAFSIAFVSEWLIRRREGRKP